MFSMQKIAVFAIVILVLWLGFRLIASMERQRNMTERMNRPSWRERLRRTAMRAGPMRAREAGREHAAEVDMRPCRVCGDYVAAAGARSCGRRDCPYAPAA